MPKVLFFMFPSPERTALLTRHAPPTFEVEIHPADLPDAEKSALVAEADFLVLAPGRISESVLRAARRLKLIQLVSAGFEGMNLDLCREIGVPVANNGGANAIDVAEHTIGLILSFYRRIPDLDRKMRGGPTRDLGREAYTIHGKTAGIVGLGHIGQRVARLLGAFGATLLYSDVRGASPELERTLDIRRVPLDDLLRGADLVTLHVPLTPATRGLIGRRELSIMKENALLVNTCRGAVVDEGALIEALTERRLLGAALDVLTREPPHPDNPLLTLENVLLTPHAAGMTFDTWERRGRFIFENLERVWRGEQPLAVVSDPS